MAPRETTCTRRGIAAAALSALVLLAGCSSNDTTSSDKAVAKDSGSNPSPVSAKEAVAPVDLATNVADGSADVPVDTRVSATATDGTLDTVKMYAGAKPSKDTRVRGAFGADKASWDAASLLEPGVTYHVKMTGTNTDGESTTAVHSFTTQALSRDQQAYASMSPLTGSTVGVGMPVIVRFDIPVTSRKAVEKRLVVTTSPKVEGSWSWLSDQEIHYRPKSYWPAGTKVDVAANINGIRTAKGIYGQQDNATSFTVGKQVVSTVDVAKHTLTVRINGKVARTLPATTGKAGFATRNGVKLIMEKYLVKRMNATTVGIGENDPDYYDIPDVRYAMRVTNSGEFVHAAPWSVGSQGTANVSHGCTGLSPTNAAWFYGISQIGDVVKFINSSRTVLEPQNGWTDWNVSYATYKQGSALS